MHFNLHGNIVHIQKTVFRVYTTTGGENRSMAKTLPIGAEKFLC